MISTLFVLTMFVLAVQISADEEPYLEPLPDYYAMLNVSHEAGMKEIKRSFRKLAVEFHPDKNKSEQAQIVFQELSEAYSVLSNPEKKEEYDQLFKIFFDLNEEETAEDSVKYEDFDKNDINEDFEDTTKDSSNVDTDDHEDEFKSSEESGDEKKDEDDEDSDLDDETLYKVLKFLADNDYIITKRTRKVPSKSEDREETMDRGSRQKRSESSYNHSQYNTRSGAGFRNPHMNHDHPWTSAHAHKPRFAKMTPPEYRNQFQGSDQVYCQYTTRWEGTVKITSKTCF